MEAKLVRELSWRVGEFTRKTLMGDGWLLRGVETVAFQGS